MRLQIKGLQNTCCARKESVQGKQAAAGQAGDGCCGGSWQTTGHMKKGEGRLERNKARVERGSRRCGSEAVQGRPERRGREKRKRRGRAPLLGGGKKGKACPRSKGLCAKRPLSHWTIGGREAEGSPAWLESRWRHLHRAASRRSRGKKRAGPRAGEKRRVSHPKHDEGRDDLIDDLRKKEEIWS